MVCVAYHQRYHHGICDGMTLLSGISARECMGWWGIKRTGDIIICKKVATSQRTFLFIFSELWTSFASSLCNWYYLFLGYQCCVLC